MPPETVPTGGRSIGAPVEPTVYDSEHVRHLAKLVFSELQEAAGPLTASELRDRTLIPERLLGVVLDELQDRGLCESRERRKQLGPTRFVANLPADA